MGPTFAPTPNPTPNPTPYPFENTQSVKPTLIPSWTPSIKATQNPTISTTDYLKTTYPSMAATNVFYNLSLTENVEQILNLSQDKQPSNGLLIGMILLFVFIALCIGSCYGLKCMRRRGKYHINIGVDDDDDEDLDLDDVDIMNLIHGKQNNVNDLNVDDIVERATIDLMKLSSKKEKDLSLVITNGQTDTKQ